MVQQGKRPKGARNYLVGRRGGGGRTPLVVRNGIAVRCHSKELCVRVHLLPCLPMPVSCACSLGPPHMLARLIYSPLQRFTIYVTFLSYF